MILNALVARLKRRSKDDLSGRGADYPTSPPQTPACDFPVRGVRALRTVLIHAAAAVHVASVPL
jgi:hypothetical protein